MGLLGDTAALLAWASKNCRSFGCEEVAGALLGLGLGLGAGAGQQVGARGKFLSERTDDAAASGRTLTRKNCTDQQLLRTTGIRNASGDCTSTEASPTHPRVSW